MGRRYNRKLTIFISFLLIISFTNQSIAPSYSALRYSLNEGYTLSPRCMFQPIVYDEVGDKGILAATIIEQALKSQSISQFPINDFFSVRASKTIEVFFSQKEELGFNEKLAEELGGIILIPCKVDNKEPYYACLLRYRDGRAKVYVYTQEEYVAVKDELRELLSPKAIERLMASPAIPVVARNSNIQFVDVTDEGVQAVSAFLERIGLDRYNSRFLEIVNARKLFLIEWIDSPFIFVDGITITEARDKKKRAQSILEKILPQADIDRFRDAFDVFWNLYEEGKWNEFNLDSIDPELRLKIAGMKREGNPASNEGGIIFADEAYTETIRTGGISVTDCIPVLDDIKRVFADVAEHVMNEHNAQVPASKEAAARAILRLAKTAAIESARQGRRSKVTAQDLQIPIDEIKEMPKKVCEVLKEAGYKDVADLLQANVTKLSKLDGIGYKPIRRGDMPGLDPEKIVMGEQEMDFLNCLLPSDIVDLHQKIMLNPQFVKVMYILWKRGAHTDKGNIYEDYIYPENRDDPEIPSGRVIGNIYESILRSVAIHTIRGHFEIHKESGFLRFNPDETKAQGERGGKTFLYTNVFAMLFYWIIFVERSVEPYDRAENLIFLKRLPIFNKLTEQEKHRLPPHLTRFTKSMMDKDILVFPHQVDLTGVTWQRLNKFLNTNYPGTASNEGIASQVPEPQVEEKWAHAVLNVVEDVKKTEQKRVLALELDWITEGQRLLIQPLIQEIARIQSGGLVEIVIKGKEESPEGFAKRIVGMSTASGGTILPENIIVLANKDTIIKDEEVCPIWDTIKDKAFLVGIDNQKLTDNSYIRLLEMITMAGRMALGQRPISSHPDIGIKFQNSRVIIFTPKAEPLDPEHIKAIYQAQIKILFAA